MVERAGFEPELRSSELGRPVGIRIFAPQETDAISGGYYFSSMPARGTRQKIEVITITYAYGSIPDFFAAH